MEMLKRLGGAFTRQGLEVAYNSPYSGGYITQRYGPGLMARGLLAVQIELNKGLFLDLASQQLIPPRLEEVRQRVRGALEEFAAGL
jgi:N-formylglutamate amidohydrolase